MSNDINDIRQEFLNFFQKKAHQIVPSSSLIPDSDDSLLFTNSGMNQFKDIFLRENSINEPVFKRVVTAQRCMRAGGKHNDLNNVGYTNRHLTFFEMLGNFSFGDYFKRESIEFAMELLTDRNWFNLSIDKLLVTVHLCDTESYNIWLKEIGISSERIVKIGKNINDFYDSDNFWQMGDVGPCGPCSEIFYDRGDQLLNTSLKNLENPEDRYIEIWNLVFIQFERHINGQLLPLSTVSIDTGMGLERITSVLQRVDSVYSIRLFKNLINDILKIIKIKNISIINHSLYVIADHLRSCSFLIYDGVIPNNDGRGYVLRRIIRRAILHGKKLGVEDIFFYKLVNPLIENMQYFSKILQEKQDFIENILLQEEQLFESTLKRGLELLENKLCQLKGNILSGITAFDLYSTHGFPLELTKDICCLHNIKVNQIEFDQAMLQHKNNAKQFHMLNIPKNCSILACTKPSIFIGYKHLKYKSQVLSLLKDNTLVRSISLKDKGTVILDITPFYGESGGQVGDSGQLESEYGCFEVINTKKYGRIVSHLGQVISGVINVGDQIVARVDQCKRYHISLNHSATHLLYTVLYNVLGSHIKQKGSLVNDQCLRFDFSHYDALTITQINTIEHLVNQQIWNNLPIMVDIMPLDVAQNIKGIILFSENQYYSKQVRVLSIGHFSIQLCGGTHATNSGEIGLFFITKEYSVASGIRRIEAVTENIALSIMQSKKKLLQDVLYVMQSDDKNLLNNIDIFKLRYRKLDKEVLYLKKKQMIQEHCSFTKEIKCIKNIQVLVKLIQNIEYKLLFAIIDNIKYQLKSGIIILINIKKNKKIHLLVSVTKDLIEFNQINALELVRYITNAFGGKGGGRPDLAQAGIDNIEMKPDVLTKLNALLHNIL